MRHACPTNLLPLSTTLEEVAIWNALTSPEAPRLNTIGELLEYFTLSNIGRKYVCIGGWVEAFQFATRSPLQDHGFSRCWNSQ